MQIVRQLQELNEALSTESNKSIGFVPTMGFLHRGHLSLINESQKKADFTIVSIFVNPTQFNNPTDLKNYPVSLKEDLMTLEKQEVDLVFCPDYDALYQNEKPVEISLGTLDSVLEGTKRKGHFQGVIRVVNIFFKLINPNYAFFGEKDYQQILVIKKLIKTYKLKVKIETIPTVREKNGLAMSSRNILLDNESRFDAKIIYEALCVVKKMIKTCSFDKIKDFINKLFLVNEQFNLEYFCIAESCSLKEAESFDPKIKVRAFICVKVQGIRLIDNIALN